MCICMVGACRVAYGQTVVFSDRSRETVQTVSPLQSRQSNQSQSMPRKEMTLEEVSCEADPPANPGSSIH
jgi:hypothetical protein